MRTHLGQYRIEETLGRGGMGVVYRGVHENLGRQVAIKALAPELTQQPEFKERFFSEAKAQARLTHPNIVGVYDLVEDSEEYFIVMEFVDGVGLDDRFDVASNGAVPLSTAATVMGQILSALDYAHSEGVIHRDIKPSNIMVTDEGRVKLADFGIALLIGDKRLTSSQSTIGTPTYMSPEQILSPKTVDHRTDIYSAAVVLYEMLAGRPPFDDETEYGIKKQHVEVPPPDLREIQPNLPPALVLAIATALEKDPETRFASAGEFWREIQGAVPETEQDDRLVIPARVPKATVVEPRISGTEPGQLQTGPAPAPASSERSSFLATSQGRKIVVGSAAAVLLVLVVLAFAFAGGSDEEGEPVGVDAVSAESTAPRLGREPIEETLIRDRAEEGDEEPVRLASPAPQESPSRSDELERGPGQRVEPPRRQPAVPPAPAPAPASAARPTPAPVPAPELSISEPVVEAEPEPDPPPPAAAGEEFDLIQMREVLDDLVRLSERAADAADDEDLETIDDHLDDFQEATEDARKTFRRATGTGILGRIRPDKGTDEAAFRELEIEIQNLVRAAEDLSGQIEARASGTKTGDLWREVRQRVRRLAAMPLPE